MTEIKRPTVYAALTELVRKGLIEEDKAEKSKYYIVLSSDRILSLVSKERRKVEEKELLAKNVIKELSKIPRSQNFEIPEIKVSEGKKNKEYFEENIPLWIKSMREIGETTQWGFQDEKILENQVVLDAIDFFWKNAAGVDLKLISNDSEAEEALSPKYKRRQLKYYEGIDFKSTQFISGDYVVNISTKKDGDLYIIQIKDSGLAESTRDLYKVLWEKI